MSESLSQIASDQLMEALDDLEKFQRWEEEDDEIAPISPLISSVRMLAFDQSIANTGVCFLRGKRVMWTGNVKTTPIHKGHEDTLTRGVMLFNQFIVLLNRHQPDVVVHEMPPVGSRMIRPEASLVSALALRCAAAMREIQVMMVGAQKAKKRLTGDPKAKKGEIREAIKRMDPNITQMKPLNEAIYDSIAVGWTALELYGQ